MRHDDLIGHVIRHNHCSYVSKITTGNFCRNPYNVTGICYRSSCPLANSRYATIRDHEEGGFKNCFHPCIHEEDDCTQEPEVEYVEDYDELEEEEDIGDCGGFMEDEFLKDEGNMDEDEINMPKEPVPKKIRRASDSHTGNVEDAPRSKSKRKGRVHIEVERDEEGESHKAYS